MLPGCSYPYLYCSVQQSCHVQVSLGGYGDTRLLDEHSARSGERSPDSRDYELKAFLWSDRSLLSEVPLPSHSETCRTNYVGVDISSRSPDRYYRLGHHLEVEANISLFRAPNPKRAFCESRKTT